MGCDDAMTKSETKKIKIAQVIGDATTGGVISCVMNYFRYIDTSKVQFDFYTYGPSPFDEEIISRGGRVFHFPSVFAFFKCVRSLRRQFKEERYDIVHAHMTSLSFVSLLAAKRAGVKHRICHAHSTTNKEEKFVYLVKSCLKHISTWYATDLAGCSKLSIDWLYGKKAAKKAYLMHNAIDLEKFLAASEKRQEFRAQYGLENCRVIGHIGRFEFQKNIPFLVKAFALARKSRDDLRLVLVGGGSEFENVKQLVDKLKIADKVLFMTERRNVEEYYALFDVFALPSRYEGLPLVAIEAQAMGIPCLLSDCITKETDVTGHVEYLPILSANFWSIELQKAVDTKGRYDGVKAVAEHGYDIRVEAQKLLQYYLEVSKK